MQQAQTAAGNISASGTYRDGVLHTLSVWEDKQSMRKFLVAGAHMQAMKVSDAVSTKTGTKVYGYTTDTIPTMDEAIALWKTNGTRHGKLVKPETDSPSGNKMLKTMLPLALISLLTIFYAAS